MAEQEQGQIQRDGSAPVQQVDAVQEHVDLIGALADEFGIPRVAARREIMTGIVSIDGEPVPQPLIVPREEIEGKTIEVQGGETNRTFRFQIQ